MKQLFSVYTHKTQPVFFKVTLIDNIGQREALFCILDSIKRWEKEGKVDIIYIDDENEYVVAYRFKSDAAYDVHNNILISMAIDNCIRHGDWYELCRTMQLDSSIIPR